MLFIGFRFWIFVWNKLYYIGIFNEDFKNWWKIFSKGEFFIYYYWLLNKMKFNFNEVEMFYMCIFSVEIIGNNDEENCWFVRKIFVDLIKLVLIFYRKKF